MIKGWIGEKKTQYNLWLGLDTTCYKMFHNIILPSLHGTAQIDHILLSPFGVFIVETKNYTGWIYGSKSSKVWTQIIYGSKYTFQNPLRQTYRQKKVLSQYLKISESLIHTVVSFVGDAQFKTELPSNVLRSGVSAYIKQFQNVVFSNAEIQRMSDLLLTVDITKKEHLKSLENRYTSNIVCPKCASKLVIRKSKQGANKEYQFLGCSAFPKCRFTKELPQQEEGKLPIIIVIVVFLILIIFTFLY